MVLVSYDISDNKLRTKFAKDLSKYGFRLQYSLFQIGNSEHLLDNFINILESKYSSKFCQSDSVMIIRLNPNCIIDKYGYAKNEDTDAFVIG